MRAEKQSQAEAVRRASRIFDVPEPLLETPRYAPSPEEEEQFRVALSKAAEGSQTTDNAFIANVNRAVEEEFQLSEAEEIDVSAAIHYLARDGVSLMARLATTRRAVAKRDIAIGDTALIELVNRRRDVGAQPTHTPDEGLVKRRQALEDHVATGFIEPLTVGVSAAIHWLADDGVPLTANPESIRRALAKRDLTVGNIAMAELVRWRRAVAARRATRPESANPGPPPGGGGVAT